MLEEPPGYYNANIKGGRRLFFTPRDILIVKESGFLYSFFRSKPQLVDRNPFAGDTEQMCIATLEEKYQRLQHTQHFSPLYFTYYARQASVIQREMRVILDEVAPALCAFCEHKCCEGFPLEGWFSLEDYVLFRLKYERPITPPNRINRITACSFLTPEGCSLPSDMRPFTCVKINCERLNETLSCLGKENHFNMLRKALDTIHREVSQRINGPDSVLTPAGHQTGNTCNALNNTNSMTRGDAHV